MHRFGSTRIELLQGDITKQQVDAIINAANAELIGGGGVDGSIHRAGGPEIMKECAAIRERQGGCPTGSAVITTGGKLPARHVIHTAGPIWFDYPPEECDRLLASCYTSCLSLALGHDLRSLAFPSISTGVYGFPIDRAAPLVLKTVRDFVESKPFEEIRFVLFSPRDLAVYEKAIG